MAHDIVGNQEDVVKKIVFGNVAYPFGKKRDEDGHTHQWTVYVKPLFNEDLSVWVKKVHFKLHDSYSYQNRIVTKPPYEVTETGWGEFEIAIKIYFQEPCQDKPVSLYHLLKLFPHANGSEIMLNGRKCVCTEHYDEIIFTKPPEMMAQLLATTRPLTLGPYVHNVDFEVREEEVLADLTTARQVIRNDVHSMRSKAKECLSIMNEARTLLGDSQPAVSLLALKQITDAAMTK
ncbi:unnamed protein product [Cyprideis torosa]|uniref:YEATS domain-containing protein n=1 Tax=Cyprideis torosa TaxID=163714 RepID=A0A7R8WM10_9CRUS|nr:unnamed protein product [Cyprideis torosa]CAG0904904.1 unnamed protein product [Cyprideis torosa]